MKIKSIAIIVTGILLIAGCNKSPMSSTTNNNPSQPPPPVQAEPFHGQIYKSLDGRTVLTLVSKDECELNQNGTILLCKYTKPNGTLRIVTTALGTSEVIYLRITDQGLVDNNGNVLYSPEGYTAAVETLQQQQQQERKKQQERQRVAEEIENSAKETRTISTFPLYQVFQRDATQKYIVDGSMTLTDVSAKIHTVAHLTYYNQEGWDEIYFTKTTAIGDVGQSVQSDAFEWKAIEFAHPQGNINSSFNSGFTAGVLVLYFQSESEAKVAHDAVVAAFEAWKAKFPDAVLR